LGHEGGGRNADTGRRLFTKIRDIACANYATDNWEAYRDFIPPHKHVLGKRHTVVAESGNARIRHYLARFHRRTKCYSKSAAMVDATLLLFAHKKLVLSILC
jgi:insertion element IS1 protein InsB